MAWWYWLFRQTTARYPTLESAVRTQIIDAAEDQGIAVDADALTGTQRRWVFDRRYEWEIQPVSDQYLLFEKQYISGWWYLLFGSAVVLGAAAILLRPPARFIAYAGSLLSFALLLPPFLTATPVDATVAANEDYRTHPAAPIIVILTALLVIATVIMGGIALTVTPDVWPFTFLLALTVVVFVLLYRQQRSPVQFRPEDVPHIYELISGYLAHIQLGVVPASALIALHSQLRPRPSYGSLSYLPFAVIAVLILAVMHRLLTRQRPFMYHEFREGGETVTRLTRRIPVLILLTIAAVGMVAIFLLFVSNYAAVLLGGESLARVSLGVALLPLLYIPTGVLLQTGMSLRETIGLFWSSTPTTVDTSVEIDPQIRVIETDRLVVGSYSLGIRDYIFISTAVVDRLPSEELGAVLAHEEGHVKNGDALLSFLIPIAALFLVTGKNVVYAALDFRTREFRADAYAVEKAGESTLTTALRTIASKQDTETAVEAWVSVAPTFISLSGGGEAGSRDRFFGAFFGNFGLTEAHPGYNERIDHIDRVSN